MDPVKRSLSAPMNTIGGMLLERKLSARDMEASDGLLTALESCNIANVRSVVSRIPEGGLKTALTASSLLTKHHLRTPLMAAAATRDFAIFTAVVHALDRQFPLKLHRGLEMRTQLGIKDKEGMTVAMHAAKSGNVATVSALIAEIELAEASFALVACDYKQTTLIMHAASEGNAPIFREVQQAIRRTFKHDVEGCTLHITRKSGDDKNIMMLAARSGDPMTLKMVAEACKSACPPQEMRQMIRQQDSDGMSLLMHAAHCHGYTPATPDANRAAAGTIDVADSNGLARDIEAPAPAIGRSSSIGESSLGLGGLEAQSMDPVVPVFKVATALVKECLWKGQVREQLKIKDLWGRSILTHAVMSGHEQLFEAALHALRDDVLDDEVAEMLEISADDREDSPMRLALVQGGTSMQRLFAHRVGHLKKDVEARKKASTIEAKIQSFIPGKLIVIFQLLLPEIDAGLGQVYLLLAMCTLAPLLNWAKTQLLKATPSDKDARLPRRSLISTLLGAPAMFFWGVGTSNIGATFGWSESLSATALAVATICIPALDAFFNSKVVEQWYEQCSCQKIRFSRQANLRWRKSQETSKRADRRQRPHDFSDTMGSAKVADGKKSIAGEGGHTSYESNRHDILTPHSEVSEEASLPIGLLPAHAHQRAS